VEFDQEAPIVVTDTSELFARGDLAAQLTQVCSTAWIQAVISDRAAHRTRYVVREEGWRDMTSLSSLQMFQQWLKLSRHYGISNIVILHRWATSTRSATRARSSGRSRTRSSATSRTSSSSE
jgi:hypothetical protein